MAKTRRNSKRTSKRTSRGKKHMRKTRKGGTVASNSRNNILYNSM